MPISLDICTLTDIVVSYSSAFACFFVVFLPFYTLFSLSYDIQRVGEGHSSADITRYLHLGYCTLTQMPSHVAVAWGYTQ